MQPTKVYLKGLNSIRFFAALFVVLWHGHRSLVIAGVYQDNNYAAFHCGAAGVDLFFTLSGFLITYLLIREIGQTGTVSISSFYKRRVLRIWPLYFLCLFCGLFVLTAIVPKVTGTAYVEWPIWKVLLLYVFFLPNLASSYCRLGLLAPLWSIGVEEQFYLSWAPLAKLFSRRVRELLIAVVLLTTAWHFVLNDVLAPYLDPRLYAFLQSMRFCNMAIGALFAHILHFRMQWYSKSWMAQPIGQIALLGLVLWYFLRGIPAVPPSLMQIILALSYGCIFINVSSLERSVVNLERQPFTYLGEISYGLYMCHLYVDYVLRYFWQRYNPPVHFVVSAIAYQMLLLTLGVVVAAISHRYFEQYFLRLGHAPPVTLPFPRPAIATSRVTRKLPFPRPASATSRVTRKRSKAA
jgi:peptidoglycan/LPS O-acetylase OafA/YrhL